MPRNPYPGYHPDGVTIRRLDGESAWTRAGLVVHDVIESVNGEWTPDEAAFRKAADGALKGVLKYSDELTVSVDYNHDPHSSIFDATSTFVIEGTFAKVFAWYDNEWGFSNRMVDVAKLLTK